MPLLRARYPAVLSPSSSSSYAQRNKETLKRGSVILTNWEMDVLAPSSFFFLYLFPFGLVWLVAAGAPKKRTHSCVNKYPRAKWSQPPGTISEGRVRAPWPGWGTRRSFCWPLLLSCRPRLLSLCGVCYSDTFPRYLVHTHTHRTYYIYTD